MVRNNPLDKNVVMFVPVVDNVPGCGFGSAVMVHIFPVSFVECECAQGMIGYFIKFVASLDNIRNIASAMLFSQRNFLPIQ